MWHKFSIALLQAVCPGQFSNLTWHDANQFSADSGLWQSALTSRKTTSLPGTISFIEGSGFGLSVVMYFAIIIIPSPIRRCLMPAADVHPLTAHPQMSQLDRPMCRKNAILMRKSLLWHPRSWQTLATVDWS